jgi:putative NIF3 family GTP cyclohydrolase 1 type 2
VSDALAHRLGLTDLRPLVPSADDPARGTGRVGRLDGTLALSAFVELVAGMLPPTAWGVRAAGDPQRPVGTVAVCGGAGDPFLADARRAGVDAYLTADLRHHPVSEYVADGGPALVEAAHWATEQPWLDELGAGLTAALGLRILVSDLETDPWTLHFRAVKPTGDAWTDPKEGRP